MKLKINNFVDKYLNFTRFILDIFIIDTPYRIKNKLDLIEKSINDIVKNDFNQKYSIKNLFMDDKIHNDLTEKLKENDIEIKRLDKILKEFNFEMNFSFYASLFTTTIYEIMMMFICINYIGIDTILSYVILILNYSIIPVLIYRYWVIQTDKYYGKLI